MVIGYPGEAAHWFQNPKSPNAAWPSHVALSIVDTESPTFRDLTGEGKPELICAQNGQLGWAEPNADTSLMRKFHPVTPKRDYEKYTHGLGFGDVNKDGRMDILERNALWEQPLAGDTVWIRHESPFATYPTGTVGGGAQMYVYDVDGDGRNDIITSMDAHGYGLAWFQNTPKGDSITFTKRMIIGEPYEEALYGASFSQLHSIELIDLDVDGLKDIVTGKRWWAHGPMTVTLR